MNLLYVFLTLFGFAAAVVAVAIAAWEANWGRSAPRSELRAPRSDCTPSRPPQPPCNPISAERNKGDADV